MATSGSTDYTIDRSGLITAALEDLEVLGESGTATAAQLTHGATRLNLFIKSMSAIDGMPLWAMKTGYILPIADTNSMLVSSHVVNTYVQTTISAAEAIGQTVLSVTSITGISSGDQLGIELNDGTVQWTTVNGAPSGSTVTATLALAVAANAGNAVYAYTASTGRVSRPLRVTYANTHDIVTNVDTPITILTHQEYNDIGTKTSESYPTQLYYDPQLTGKFYWYPRWIDGKKVVQFRYHRPFEDFDSATDNPDFPQEWFFPVQKMLTWAISASYGKTTQERAGYLTEARYWIDQVSASGQEEGSIFFEPTQR